MSDLDRLKARVSEARPDTGATKATEAPFVPFVASLSAPLRQFSPIPAEIRRLIDRVMKLRDCPESDREAFADDWRTDPDYTEKALKHLANIYGGENGR